jgi:hypothetical protein
MSIFDDVLASNLDDKPVGNTAQLVRKDEYHKLVAWKNVHSYSQQQQLQACPKRYELMCLEADLKVQGIEIEEESNVTFAFGHSVGAGIAEYDRTGDRESAIFAAFLAWNVDLLAVQEPKPRRPDPKKSFHHAVWAVMIYENFVEEETDLADYEVVQVEANVGVDFEDGYFYTMHIDELLRNKHTGNYRVKENKTTAFTSVDPAMYQNSEQALGYSVVVGTLGAQDYSVGYCIYSSTEERWIWMDFPKSRQAQAEWLQSQLLLNGEVQEYSTINFFPKRGQSCLQFGRQCKYFGECGFDTRRTFQKTFQELDSVESLEEIEEKTGVPFDFKVTRTQLIESLRKLKGSV